jgi:phage terminase large subunit GpA-like protein
MPLFRAGLDTGGGAPEGGGEWTRTEEAYQWLRKQAPRRIVFGTKGSSRPHIAGKRIQFRVIDKMERGNRKIPGGLELRFLDTAQYKGLIHWRLGRNPNESQRFDLHCETGIDYAQQILAEELRRDRRGRVEWKQIRKANHYLDCEVIAAACADSEWLPSIKMLAQSLKAVTHGRRVISAGIKAGRE